MFEIEVNEDTSSAVDWLMYRSYEFNRDRSPDIDPQRWRKIYFNAEAYEKIYQTEKEKCLSH